MNGRIEERERERERERSQKKFAVCNKMIYKMATTTGLYGRVTMITESRENCAIILSRINFLWMRKTFD